MLLADDAALRDVEEALEITERASEDFALGFARWALGIALVHRESPAERERGLAVLGQVRDMCLKGRFDQFSLAAVDMYTARERARWGDRDHALPQMRAAIDDVFHAEYHSYGILATGFLVETLVERVGDLDTGEVREVTFADLQQDTMFVTTLVCMRRETYALAGGCAPWCFRADDYILNAGALLIDPIPRIEAPFAFYRVRPTSQSHHDRETALPLIAACLALRFGGRIPDTRPAGAFYRHLAGVDARNGAPLSRTLAFAALGGLRPKDVKILVKSHVRGKLNSVRSRRST